MHPQNGALQASIQSHPILTNSSYLHGNTTAETSSTLLVGQSTSNITSTRSTFPLHSNRKQYDASLDVKHSPLLTALVEVEVFTCPLTETLLTDFPHLTPETLKQYLPFMRVRNSAFLPETNSTLSIGITVRYNRLPYAQTTGKRNTSRPAITANTIPSDLFPNIISAPRFRYLRLEARGHFQP